MELSEKETSKLKTMLVQTYKAFREFCISNDIHFFAGGGTMIGAVRHKGIIPWDDDIDIFMLRKDYDKFISLKSQLEGSEYEIIDPSDDGYFCSQAKFSHRNSSIWEFQSILCITGVFIDVFALDYEDGSIDKVIKKRKCFNWYSNLFYISSAKHSFTEILSNISHLRLKKGVWYLVQTLVLRNLRFFFRSKISKYSSAKRGQWLVVYQSIYGNKDIYKASWIQEGFLTVPFEDTFIEVPKEYDAILSQVYGDYMAFPPEEKRCAHHSRFYVNLDKRITKEEIKNILAETL